MEHTPAANLEAWADQLRVEFHALREAIAVGTPATELSRRVSGLEVSILFAVTGISQVLTRALPFVESRANYPLYDAEAKDVAQVAHQLLGSLRGSDGSASCWHRG